MDATPASRRPRPRAAFVFLLSAIICGVLPGLAFGQAFRILHGFENPPRSPMGGLTIGPDGLLYGLTSRGGVDDRGTVIRVDATGAATLLAPIPEGPARSPQAGLTLAGSWLYGIGTGLDPLRHGSIFRVSTAGTIEILHEFDGADGSRPRSVLTLGSDGFLYGTTTAGGASGYGTLYRIAPDGSGFATVHDFTGTPDGQSPSTPLAEGEPGVFYGGTSGGGSSSFTGILYSFDSSSAAFTVLHRLTGWTGALPVSGLYWQSGELWGTTSSGGDPRCGIAFRFAGSTFETFHEFTCNAGGSGPSGGLVPGPDGALWGVTRGNLSSGWTVFRITTGGAPGLSIVHSFPGPADLPSGGLVPSGSWLFGTIEGYDGYGNLGSVFRVDALGAVETLHRFGRGDGWELLSLAEDEGGAWYGTTRRGGSAAVGTVFRIDPAGSATTIHDFPDTPAGSAPYSFVSRASDGNLYGSRNLGGPTDGGLLFQLTPDGVRTDIYLFDRLSSSDGRNPASAPIEGTDGMLYGTTPVGGPAQWGTVYRIGKDGTAFLNIFSLSGVSTGSEPSRPPVEGSDGWFYGVAPLNGWDGYSAGFGTVFRFRPDHEFQVVHQFTGYSGPDPSYTPTGGLTEVEPGRFFGAASGGTASRGVLYEVVMGGEVTAPPGTYRTLFNFGLDPSLGLNPGGALAAGPDGLFYGTTFRGGASDKGVVFRVQPDGSGLEVVHSFSGPDGSFPDGLQTGSDGDVYGFTGFGGPRGGGEVYRLCFAPGVTPGGPYSVPEGGSHLVSATQTTSKRVVFEWDLDGDGSFDAEGEEVVFSAAGLDGPSTRDVLVRVTDDCGLSSEATSTVELTNVAPVVTALPDVSLSVGDRLVRPGSFVDPGPDVWSATVDYGDGSGPQPLPLSGRSFTLDHVYAAGGTFIVTVTVSDDDGGVGSASFVVTAESIEAAIEGLIDDVQELIDDGRINRGRGRSLIVKLENALRFLERPGDEAHAANMLEQFIKEVQTFIRVGGLAAEDGDPLIAIATLILEQLVGP